MSLPGERSYRIAEIFGPTIQGEGAMAGALTHFIRFGGCDDRCSWCDSPHAVLPEYAKTWPRMDGTAVLSELRALGAVPGGWITLSGGNPALWPLRELICRLQVAGLRVAMETQGTLAKDWFGQLDHLCISPKPPSSGNVTDLEKVDDALGFAPVDRVLKVVCFDALDVEYLAMVVEAFPDERIYASVGNENIDVRESSDALRNRIADKTQWLLQELITKSWWPRVRLLPQVHTLIWGNARAV